VIVTGVSSVVATPSMSAELRPTSAIALGVRGASAPPLLGRDRGGHPLLNWRPAETLSLRPEPGQDPHVFFRGSSPP
jgi:hypothetical protein